MILNESEVLVVPLGIGIQILSDRIQADLRAGYDYYEHSKSNWHLVRRMVRRGTSITFDNIHTGTSVQAAELPALARTYIKSYLAESVFQHFVALFEDFVFELVRLWLTAYPGGIPNKKEKRVELATLIEARDRDAILQAVIDGELNASKYERPTVWFRYLNDRVKLGIPAGEQIERFAEIKASRDILAHNRGIINQTYLDKSGRRSRYQLGQLMEIPEPYLHDAWLLIRGLVEDLAAAAIAKA
jgi:hypothetical protein